MSLQTSGNLNLAKTMSALAPWLTSRRQSQTCPKIQQETCSDCILQLKPFQLIDPDFNEITCIEQEMYFSTPRNSEPTEWGQCASKLSALGRTSGTRFQDEAPQCPCCSCIRPCNCLRSGDHIPRRQGPCHHHKWPRSRPGNGRAQTIPTHPPALATHPSTAILAPNCTWCCSTHLEDRTLPRMSGQGQAL